MSQSSSKPFAPIRDAYAFFLQHSTEMAADIRAYLPHLPSLTPGDRPLRMLDFGCGDGVFTAALLGHVHWPAARLQLALVEPDDVYRQQAVMRLQSYAVQPMSAWPTLPPHLQARVDFVLVNHVLYYVPDLDGTLAALYRALAPSGLFLTAMAGQRSIFAQWCQQCFTWLGRPYPFHGAEDLERTLVQQGVPYGKEDVNYTLDFPDREENRLTLMRFLLGSAYEDVPQSVLLALFEPYVQGTHIVLHLLHEHFIIRPQAPLP